MGFAPAAAAAVQTLVFSLSLLEIVEIAKLEDKTREKMKGERREGSKKNKRDGN